MWNTKKNHSEHLLSSNCVFKKKEKNSKQGNKQKRTNGINSKIIDKIRIKKNRIEDSIVKREENGRRKNKIEALFFFIFFLKNFLSFDNVFFISIS